MRMLDNTWPVKMGWLGWFTARAPTALHHTTGKIGYETRHGAGPHRGNRGSSVFLHVVGSLFTAHAYASLMDRRLSVNGNEVDKERNRKFRGCMCTEVEGLPPF